MTDFTIWKWVNCFPGKDGKTILKDKEAIKRQYLQNM